MAVDVELKTSVFPEASLDRWPVSSGSGSGHVGRFTVAERLPRLCLWGLEALPGGVGNPVSLIQLPECGELPRQPSPW